MAGPVIYNWRPLCWPFVCFHQYPIKMEHISGKPLGVSLELAGRPTADVWVDSLLAWLVISLVCTWRFHHWRMVFVRLIRLARLRSVKLGLVLHICLRLIFTPLFTLKSNKIAKLILYYLMLASPPTGMRVETCGWLGPQNSFPKAYLGPP